MIPVASGVRVWIATGHPLPELFCAGNLLNGSSRALMRGWVDNRDPFIREKFIKEHAKEYFERYPKDR